MHTGIRLDLSQFEVRLDGVRAEPQDAFDGFDRADRFGLIVDRPVGGVGASLLLQLAITGFYAADSSRRNHVYPEVYVFHVGGWHGSFGWYDVFPIRKEVVVENDPPVILEALNDRGITSLAVVDGPIEIVRHRHQEPAAALQRIRTAFAYSPSGRVLGADVEIATRAEKLFENTDITLDPEGTRPLQQELIDILPGVLDGEDFLPPDPPAVDPEYLETMRAQRVTLFDGPVLTESYRRIPTVDALGMLHARLPVAQNS